MWLTPAERRGALVLVAILLIGTGWDLWQASPWRPRRVTRFAADSVSVSWAGNAQRSNDLPDSSRVALDLNRATEAELDALPGIGPVLAGRIVGRRARAGPYRETEDLLDLPGIGPRLFERLRPMITVSRPSPAPDSMQSAKKRAPGRADSPSVADSSFR